MLTLKGIVAFKSKELVKINLLGDLLKDSSDSSKLVMHLKLAASALWMSLSYAKLHEEIDDDNHKMYIICEYKLDNYMKFNSFAMRALNVMERIGEENSSVVRLMNKTHTKGIRARLLNMWLQQPLVDAKEINFRLDVV